MAATLQTFGGSTTDFILDPGNDAKPLPNTPYTIIDATTMLPATGLQDASGAAVTQLTSDGVGRFAGSALLAGAQFYLQANGSDGVVYTFGPMVSTTAVADTLSLAPQLDSIASSAAASAFAAKQAQAAAEAVQTGTTTTDASKLVTGTLSAARLPDLSGVYGAKATVDANAAAVAATQAQQTQLMGSAALKEELCTSVILTAINDPVTAYISANTVQTIFVPPYPLQVTSIAFNWEYYNLTASDTNYWTVSVQKRTGTTGTSFVSKNTMVLGEGITARKAWRLDGASWNVTNSQLSLSDTLALNIFMTGTPTPMRLPMTVTFRWLPL